MKKQLEEQIINLYLNNNINNDLKEKLLSTLNDCFNKQQLNRLKIVLNNPTYLKNVVSFSERQLALKEDKFDILERTIADETHARSVFNSLVKKGFINGNDQKGYSVYEYYLNLNPDTLTDEEFVTFDGFFEIRYRKILKTIRNK